nr:MAG TPA: hypothetical protein [Caudoviricetes sp.]
MERSIKVMERSIKVMEVIELAPKKSLIYSLIIPKNAKNLAFFTAIL